jgi:hypothetical protein
VVRAALAEECVGQHVEWIEWMAIKQSVQPEITTTN